MNCRLARCLLSACGFPYNWKAPTCCSLSASDVEVTQARSLPPCCDACTGTRTQHRKHAAHGLLSLISLLRAFPLNVIKRNQGSVRPAPSAGSPPRRGGRLGWPQGQSGVWSMSSVVLVSCQRPPWNGPNGPNGDLRGGTPAHLGGSLQSN